jgi:D-alanyl-D-alanine carboxypeptidase
MRRGISGIVLGLALAVGVTTPVAGADPDRTALQQALDELANAGAAGVQLRVTDAHGEWTGTAGVASLDHGGAVPVDGRFRAGSVTKMFVATVVLQLVDEGRVALDDPASQYLPELGIDPRITVRMLLQHTSGIFSYTGEPNPDGTVDPGIPVTGQEFVDTRFDTYTPTQLVELALSKPARFEPGTQWRYSNTNYQVLRLLIEKLTHTSYALQLKLRLLWPLGLHATFLPGTATGIPGRHAHGYLTYPYGGAEKTVDVTRLNPSPAGAAGELVSTTEDLDHFLTVLLGGDLLSADLLTQMRTGHPDSGYGLGLAEMDTGPACGGIYYGHGGDIQGYQSAVYGNDAGTRVAISITTGTVNMADPTSAKRYNDAITKVLTVATCGA